MKHGDLELMLMVARLLRRDFGFKGVQLARFRERFQQADLYTVTR